MGRLGQPLVQRVAVGEESAGLFARELDIDRVIAQARPPGDLQPELQLLGFRRCTSRQPRRSYGERPGLESTVAA